MLNKFDLCWTQATGARVEGDDEEAMVIRADETELAVELAEGKGQDSHDDYSKVIDTKDDVHDTRLYRVS